MLDYVFTLKTSEDSEESKPFVRDYAVAAEEHRATPGNGAPLESVHPSYDLTTLHGGDFRPKSRRIGLYARWKAAFYNLGYRRRRIYARRISGWR